MSPQAGLHLVPGLGRADQSGRLHCVHPRKGSVQEARQRAPLLGASATHHVLGILDAAWDTGQSVGAYHEGGIEGSKLVSGRIMCSGCQYGIQGVDPVDEVSH